MIDPIEPNFKLVPSRQTRWSFNYSRPADLEKPVVSILSRLVAPEDDFAALTNCIRAQSLQNWEWLIFTPTVPEGFQALVGELARDSRIKFVAEELTTLSAALPHCESQNLVSLNSDMRIEPSMLEKSYWYLQSHFHIEAVSTHRIVYGIEPKLFECKKQHQLQLAAENGNGILLRATALAARQEPITLGVIPEFLTWQRETNELDFLVEYRVLTRAEQTAEPSEPKLERQLLTPNFEQPIQNTLRKDKRRFLLLAPWLTLGGVDKFNLDLTKQLIKNDWEVSIASLVEHGCHMWMPKFAEQTPDVFRLHSFLKPEDHLRFLVYLIRSRKIDVAMVTLTEFGYLLLPYLRAECPDTVFVDYCHALPTDWINFPGYAVLSQQFLDLNIVSSRALKDWMTEHNGEAERIEVAYTNIDTKKWTRNLEVRHQLRTRYEIAEDELVIVYACRFTQQKQPKVFAQTIKALADSGLKFHAFIAGHGELGVWMDDYFKAHNLLEHATFFGPVPNDKLYDLMSASDIYFLPSIYEGISLAVYEAMSMELMVLSADVGGQKELVTAECGILMPHRDEQHDLQNYTNVLGKLLAQPALCRKMGTDSRLRVENLFELDQMGLRMISLFNRAIELKKTNSRPAIDKQTGIALGIHALQYSQISRQIDQFGEQGARLRSRIEERVAVINELDANRNRAMEELTGLSSTFDNNTESINFLLKQQHEIFAVFVKLREMTIQQQISSEQTK